MCSLSIYLVLMLSFALIVGRFSLGATARARGDHQAPIETSAARALNAKENAGAAVASRIHKYVT